MVSQPQCGDSAPSEQAVYLDDNGVEHPTLPAPPGSVWPDQVHTHEQTLRLRTVGRVA
ncbi:hypothetical protein MHY13_03810 [Corynebacterium sp. ACRPE]|uniref:hypothetical protein n=1 Tax=Corynebacterium sp. ACRPE TaxID=2918196 RepID=UPI001EF5BDF2|nr:hypothetical protein [Corynebacterium sp. ACRPE]MCG7467258.1 hypothetical protein [Corynebacterium sp. ACRPE]